jgi:hypothetical protein
LIVAARPAMATPTTVQRETVRLAAILETVLRALIIRLLRRLWRRSAAGDEGRQALMPVALLRARLIALLVRLTIALLARLIILIVARRERLCALRQIGLRLTRRVRRLERLVLVVAFLESLFLTRLELLVVAAAFLTRLEVWILLPELLLRGGDQAEIMFGVLEIVFRCDRITGRLRVACELQIFLGDVIGGAANLYVGTVRFINPSQGILIAAVVIVLTAPPTHTLVVVMLLTVSHGLLFDNSDWRRL